MRYVELSAPWWKALIAVLALGMFALVAREAVYGGLAMSEHKIGFIGHEQLDRYGTAPDGGGTYEVTVETVTVPSPLAEAGVRRGDVLRFKRPLDRWRIFEANERVELTVLRRAGAGEVSAPIDHTVIALPKELTGVSQVDYWGRLLVSLAALAFAVLVAFRKPVGFAYRCLALMFLTLSSSFFYSFTFAPAGWLSSLSKGLQLTLYDLILYFYIGFVINYDDYKPTRLRNLLNGAGALFQVLALAGAVCAFGFALKRETPFLQWLTPALLACGVVLALLSLFDGWRNSNGNMRSRHLWLLSALAMGSIPPLLTIPAMRLNRFGMNAWIVLFIVGQVAMYVMLLYATLKHRVFDFGYVMSRVAVKSLTNFLLLVVFLLLEWVAESIVKVDFPLGDRRDAWAFLIAAIPAIVLYAAMRGVRRRLEHYIAYLLFRRWANNRAKLRNFVAGAGDIDSVQALLAALLAELERFNGGAGTAIYLRRRDGDFELATATLPHVPSGYDSNDELVVALCGDQAPVRGQLLGAGIDVALPMCRRGALLGFVLLGCKAQGESYRPDEAEVLGWAVGQIGLDLRALHVAQLERDVSELEQRAAMQHKVLLAVLGRRSLGAPQSMGGTR